MDFRWSDQFELYLNELLEWNKKHNLTAITDREEAKYKHFYDSLTLQDAFDFSLRHVSVIDVGSGAGFPGLPVKIKFPDISLVLLDSTEKKVKFMEHIISKLDLKDVKAVWSRAEDYSKEKKQEFDVALCRALAPLNVAAELCLPFLKEGGKMLAMKSNKIEDELEKSRNALEILGGGIEKVITASVPDGKNGSMDRTIIVIKKTKETPSGYPRKAGIPKKRPL